LAATLSDWPGEIGKYVTYGGSHGIHAPWRAAGYALQFWGPSPVLGVVFAVALFTVVPALVKDEPLLEIGRWVSAAALALVVVYAVVGIDSLREVYIGIFTRAIPLFMFFLVLIGAMRKALPSGVPGIKYAAVGLLAIGLVVSGLTHSLANRRQNVPGIPSALDTMHATAGDRPIVITLDPQAAWAEGIPLVLSAERRGIRMCLATESLRLIATDRLMCTSSERHSGAHFVVMRKEAITPGAKAVADLGRSAVIRRDSVGSSC
jgi:hypothetical protein